MKYFAGYFHVCAEANLTILQHIWNASHHSPLSLPDQAEQGRKHLFMGGFPLAVQVTPQSPGPSGLSTEYRVTSTSQPQPRCEHRQGERQTLRQ